jgi:hypothetical protein
VNRLIILTGLVLATSARAQETSDLQPAAPALPPGVAPPYYPGAPAPPPQAAPGAETPRGPVTKAGEKKPEPTGRTILDTSFADEESEVSAEGPVGPPPDVHVVKKGDTLWDISGFYFKDPHYWPRLWAFNPSITNPHWIYPGDLVRLALPGKAPEVVVPPPQSNEPHVRTISRPELPSGLFLRQTAFVEPGELTDAGRIIGSKEEKQLLTTLDEAYVQFKKEKPLIVGERYSVYTPLQEVKHPVTEKKVGHIVQIFGEVEVKSVTEGGIARVAIVDCTDGMERGFRVGPLKRQFKLVEAGTNQHDVVGVVLATIHPREMVGTDMLVFLDKGKKDGVDVGNRFQIVRRGDGYQPLLQKGKPQDDRRFPRETVGEILVIDVKDTYATGFVMKSAKETRIGDRVEAHRGY